MAAAYSTFARQGTYIAPKTYTMVTDNNGQVLLRNESEEETILVERTTYYITEMLQQVVTGGSGATGKAANFSGQEIAGKTGTTTSRRDLWFVGYTPYYTAAVWTGYDQQERLSSSLGNPSTGLWRQVMSAVHQNLAYKDFTQPDSSNLRTVTYCLSSGMLATLPAAAMSTGTFYADDVPTSSCTYHRVTVPTTDPDTGATGDETGDNTDPGNTDPGTDPGTDTPPTTDPGTDPTTPPAEGAPRPLAGAGGTTPFAPSVSILPLKVERDSALAESLFAGNDRNDGHSPGKTVVQTSTLGCHGRTDVIEYPSHQPKRRRNGGELCPRRQTIIL